MPVVLTGAAFNSGASRRQVFFKFFLPVAVLSVPLVRTRPARAAIRLCEADTRRLLGGGLFAMPGEYARLWRVARGTEGLMLK